MGKKQGGKGNSKEAWLDWLKDEPPTADAQAELRERFKQQANSYQPVNRAQPQPPQPAPVQPTNVAAPQPVTQPQPVSQTPPAQNPVPGASQAAKPGTPATVSIQIHIPSLQSERVQKLLAKPKQGITTVKRWLRHAKVWFLAQLAHHKIRTIVICIATPLLIVLLLLPAFIDFGKGKDKTASGSASGTSAGADAGYEKPPFQVVTPSSKTKLATPDGVHAAYDGKKNVYTYTDSVSGNGFTVSQQPIPPQFSDGPAAVESIAPTLVKSVTPVKLKPLTGQAYVATNPKYNSQALVANVRDVLIFIQSSHAFKPTEWENYLNTLQ